MRIKSPFRDYYDHIAHIYGGGDPNLTYVRRKFDVKTDWPEADTFTVDLPIDANIRGLPDSRRWNGKQYLEPEYSYKWLIIANKYYLLVGNGKYGSDKYTVLNEKDHKELIDTYLCRNAWWAANTNFDYYVGSDGGPGILQLSRAVGAPVFVCHGYRHRNFRTNTMNVVIEKNIPILSDMGIPSVLRPEQIYQDLSYYIANTMHESPDMKPPVDVSDKDRIVQHGFDLKQSFRHRK